MEFKPDGPHHDTYTVEVADAVAQALRTLAHATEREATGCTQVTTAYQIAASLATAMHHLGQVMRQLAAVLLDMEHRGVLLTAVEGGDLWGDVGESTTQAEQAAYYATDVAVALDKLAQQLACIDMKESSC